MTKAEWIHDHVSRGVSFPGCGRCRLDNISPQLLIALQDTMSLLVEFCEIVCPQNQEFIKMKMRYDEMTKSIDQFMEDTHATTND